MMNNCRTAAPPPSFLLPARPSVGFPLVSLCLHATSSGLYGVGRLLLSYGLSLSDSSRLLCLGACFLVGAVIVNLHHALLSTPSFGRRGFCSGHSAFPS